MFFLGDRDGVTHAPCNGSFRSQWADFSTAPTGAASTCRRSWIPVYGFEAVNVEAQSRSPSSLLNWVKRLIIAARRSRRAFGPGGPCGFSNPVEPQGHRLYPRLWR